MNMEKLREELEADEGVKYEIYKLIYEYLKDLY